MSSGKSHNLQIRPLKGGLGWLTDMGADVPPEVSKILLANLLSSPSVVLVSAINGLIFNLSATFLCHRLIFAVFCVFDIAFGITRYSVAKYITLRARRGETGIDIVIYGSIGWGALQGISSTVAMMTGNPTVQVLSSIMLFGAIGPVCARFYHAPRLAFLIVCLLDVPFVFGSCLSGNPWFYALLPMTPPFLFAALHTIRNLSTMSVKMLISEIGSEREARRDPLTGLSNRLAYAEKLARLVEDPQRPLVMFCLDLDGFKQINDTLGHPVGDALLQAVALRLQSCVRRDDALFRMGGDEFVIIAQGLSRAMAPVMADRILAAVASEPFLFAGQPPLRIGISVGFACSAPDDAERAELYARADRALYSAKSAGKGVVRAFGAMEQEAA